jgi:DNA-binding MltR family transcriptional regulator
MADELMTSDMWLEAISKAFSIDSDRAAAIVAGAMLDDALKALIEAILVKPIKKEHSILHGDCAPLGSFSARINAAQQLGLISNYLARDLHVVRKIRNEFAHHPLELTFESPKIRDLIAVLEKTSDYNKRHPTTRAGYGAADPRGDFLGIASWMLYSLREELPSAKRLTQHGPEFGYLDWSSVEPEFWLSIDPEVRQTLEGA